jgi:hypothetical protein
LGRLYQIMDMVGHNTQSIELKLVFVQSLLDGIKKHFPTFTLLQFKLTVIATDGDVVRISRL